MILFSWVIQIGGMICQWQCIVFFDEYDLSNKTIIPFNTSGGSAFSDTINTIKKLEPNANVIEGITIRAEDVESSQNEINEWLNDLGYNI